MSRCGCPQAADPPTACRNQFAGVGRLPATHPYFNHVRVYSTSIPPEDGRPHALRARTHLQALHASGRRCEAWCEAAAYAACCTRMDEWMIAAGGTNAVSDGDTSRGLVLPDCAAAAPAPSEPPAAGQQDSHEDSHESLLHLSDRLSGNCFRSACWRPCHFHSWVRELSEIPSVQRMCVPNPLT